MTEMVVDSTANMLKVPRSLREHAVLVEPLTIAEKAIIEVWQIQQRLPWSCPGSSHAVGTLKAGHCHHAVVLGAGPIGLLGAMAFANAGFPVVLFGIWPLPDPVGRDRALADLLRALHAGLAWTLALLVVLLFRYRGFWGSPGAFTFEHVREDAAAASLKGRSPHRGDADEVVRHG